MRAKQWAYANGHIKADGRGRMPLVSIKTGEQLATVLQKSGVKFTDWPKGKVVQVQSKTDPETTVTKVERDPGLSNEKVISEIFIRYDDTLYEAMESDGTRHNLRQACICGYSLVGHVCDSPQILTKSKQGHQPVEIVRKKA